MPGYTWDPTRDFPLRIPLLYHLSYVDWHASRYLHDQVINENIKMQPNIIFLKLNILKRISIFYFHIV